MSTWWGGFTCGLLRPTAPLSAATIAGPTRWPQRGCTERQACCMHGIRPWVPPHEGNAPSNHPLRAPSARVAPKRAASAMATARDASCLAARSVAASRTVLLSVSSARARQAAPTTGWRGPSAACSVSNRTASLPCWLSAGGLHACLHARHSRRGGLHARHSKAVATHAVIRSRHEVTGPHRPELEAALQEAPRLVCPSRRLQRRRQLRCGGRLPQPAVTRSLSPGDDQRLHRTGVYGALHS